MRKLIKAFNWTFSKIGISIANPTTMVIESASPMDISYMADGSYSMMMLVDKNHTESYWCLYVWGKSIKLTKTKVSKSEDIKISVDMGFKPYIYSGNVTLDKQESELLKKLFDN